MLRGVNRAAAMDVKKLDISDNSIVYHDCRKAAPPPYIACFTCHMVFGAAGAKRASRSLHDRSISTGFW